MLYLLFHTIQQRLPTFILYNPKPAMMWPVTHEIKKKKSNKSYLNALYWVWICYLGCDLCLGINAVQNSFIYSALWTIAANASDKICLHSSLFLVVSCEPFTLEAGCLLPSFLSLSLPLVLSPYRNMRKLITNQKSFLLFCSQHYMLSCSVKMMGCLGESHCQKKFIMHAPH